MYPLTLKKFKILTTYEFSGGGRLQIFLKGATDPLRPRLTISHFKYVLTGRKADVGRQVS